MIEKKSGKNKVSNPEETLLKRITEVCRNNLKKIGEQNLERNLQENDSDHIL